MGTTRSFSAMLNEYLPNELLKEEMVKRDWVLSNVEKDNAWKGGNLIVPFKAAGASSVAFGSLTSSTDIAEDSYVRGSVTTQPEVWGSMIFNHRDLMEHDKLSEQNFLKILPDAVDDFLSYVKMVVSLSFTNGPHFAKLTADGTAGGAITVDRPERFVLGQKLYLQDDNTAAAAYYVTAITMDTGVITVSATRGGSAANVSAYTVSQNAKCYFDGSQTTANQLSALKSMLLSSANGGGTTLYGQTKTAYPYLQAINVDGGATGSNINASNILDGIFDAYVTIKNRGKGDPSKVVMSYKNGGSILKLLETNKGAFHQDPKGTSVSVYGWTEVDILGPAGKLTVVMVQEVDDDYIMFLDTRPSVMKVYSNGFFKKRANPDGREFYEVRNTTGYQYIVDVCFFGDLILQRPSYCGILYGISY